jgi:DNA-binding response OmpR family regulator
MASGLDRFRAEPFDLVLLDVMLPRLDGYEVARQIRGTDCPIVMLTARLADTMDAVVGLEAGRRLCPQAFDLPELTARSAALRRAGTGTGEETNVSRPARDRCRRADGSRDGADVPLTRTEFDLLLELIHHAGQVLTRETLSIGSGATTISAIMPRRRRHPAPPGEVEVDPAAPERSRRPGAGKAVR